MKEVFAFSRRTGSSISRVCGVWATGGTAGTEVWVAGTLCWWREGLVVDMLFGLTLRCCWTLCFLASFASFEEILEVAGEEPLPLPLLLLVLLLLLLLFPLRPLE